ncbi:SSB protein [Gordonia Phage JonJames]|nr:SSB protein [Gordonia Phage JonJames]
MANDVHVTVTGNLAGPVELRFTPSGVAVANFTVVSNPRRFDKQTNSWIDEEPWFVRCNIWRDAAENAAESLDKGTRVIVQGRLKSRSYTTNEGEDRTVLELEVDEIGPSLQWATAKVQRTERGGGNRGGGGWANNAQQSSVAETSQAAQNFAGAGMTSGADDPWGGGTSGPPF